MFGQMTDREWRVPFAIEIDPRQTPAVHSLILNSLPNFTVSVFHDYAGKERVVTGQPPL